MNTIKKMSELAYTIQQAQEELERLADKKVDGDTTYGALYDLDDWCEECGAVFGIFDLIDTFARGEQCARVYEVEYAKNCTALYDLFVSKAF